MTMLGVAPLLIKRSADLPTGRPGHPSRAMTKDQAVKVLRAASGKGTGYVRLVKASKGNTAS